MRCFFFVGRRGNNWATRKEHGNGEFYIYHPDGAMEKALDGCCVYGKRFKTKEEAVEYGLERYVEWAEKVMVAAKSKKRKQEKEEYVPGPCSMYGA